MPSQRRGPVTAEELIKERDELYRTDPEYRAMVDRKEAEFEARHRELRRAEQPVAAALQAAGIPVESAWDLYLHKDLAETAYPILLEHLRRDYPDRILEGMARAFTKDVTREHWQELLTLYLSDDRLAVQDGLAATLSGCATRIHYDDVLAILENQKLGMSRIYFLRPANRIGNRIAAGLGRKVAERYAHDENLGVEATRILKGRGVND